MINKSSLWFITLSSIILVLAVYYIAGPSDELSMVFSDIESSSTETILDNESESITAMRVNKEEEDQTSINELNNIILDDKKSLSEKSEALSQIKYLQSEKSLEDKIENLLKDKFKYTFFVSINETTINIVVDYKKGDSILANNIINEVNSNLKDNYYVVVKFE